MATTRKSGSKSATRSASARAGNARRSATQSAAQRTSKGRSGGSGDTPERDSRGRFKTDHHVRNAAVGAAVTVGAVAAGIAAAFKFGLLDRLLPAGEGHSAEDLLIEDDADQAELRAGKSRGRGRAPADFRPDMDAPLSKADKEALRPAKGQPAAELAGADNGSVETV